MMSESDHEDDQVDAAAAATSPSTRETTETSPPGRAEQIATEERPALAPFQGPPLSTENSAIQAELEMLGPLWCQAIWAENPSGTNDQCSALLAGKLDDARRKIPLRWKEERRFLDSCRLAELTIDNIGQALSELKGKEASDESAKIEERQAQGLIADWEKVRRPDLESSYREATTVWYKPGEDPLAKTFSLLVNKFAKVVATLEFEVSRRPAIQTPWAGPQEGTTRLVKERKTIVQFDAASLIEAFDGDLEDPEVLLKFFTWSSWNSLVKEMETLQGFNQTTLFQKLRSCLTGSALKMVAKFSSESANSYESAMKELLDRFQNPISLAGLYIKDGMAPRKSVGEQADAIRHPQTSPRLLSSS